ncbi:hypothetical protein PIB30_028678 [Stylosanthes scabra]|uniref:Replication protein A 70 kDa DNA-binding subunit B/D first OB fold domain-containing protein n=1 Tax=Stylosanthes scabra TaxID=79078 RepID=A0ABU6SB44_9FABA|nr:hypothetical protein [Stylosanthes scabra]
MAKAVVQGNTHHDKVADVCATKLDWSLLVGIVRIYEMSLPSNPIDFYQVDMILQDSQGDRIQCSIPKPMFTFYKTLLQEFGLYNMRDLIVQTPGRGVRTTSHRFKLTFYQKTSVRRLSSETFPFSPFRLTPFAGVVSMTQARQFHLIGKVPFLKPYALKTLFGVKLFLFRDWFCKWTRLLGSRSWEGGCH